MPHYKLGVKCIGNRFINDIPLYEYLPLERILGKYDSNFSGNLIIDNNFKVKYVQPSMNENDFLQSPSDALKKNSYEKFKDILEKNWGQEIYPQEAEEFEAIHNRLKGFCLDNYIIALYYFFVEFLKKENNSKLFNVCGRCEEYFVMGKFDDRIKFCSNCSSKSKMSKEKRREYQRKWRQRKKQEKLAIQREARIENLMKRAGCSREEAIEFIKADDYMR